MPDGSSAEAFAPLADAQTAPEVVATAGSPLLAGQAVRVRSAVEIAATLDGDGAFERLPFMPEMAALIGRDMTVVRRADKTCVEGHGLRAMKDVVFLEKARCDGAAHDGCERGCLMFWKEAWLSPADAPAFTSDPAAEAAALQRLLDLPTKAGKRYTCQSTALAAATDPMGRLDVGHLFDDLRRGELTAARFAKIAARTVANMARRRVGLGDLDALTGPDGTASGSLDLKPGERVRIRSRADVAATLDHRSKNRGLSFEPEMTGHVGQTFKVGAPVRRIIIETSGKMVNLNSTVTLEGVDCEGRCARNCPRANPLYWREIWLERV